MRPIRVLVVDDSALVRQLLTEILASDPEIEVVGTAPDPIVARERIKALNPDVLTLDIEMPRMNGIQFLELLMRLRPMPVVMISTLTREGADPTLRALELGAIDCVAKPTSGLTEAMAAIRSEIIEKVKTAARARPKSAVRLSPAPVSSSARSSAELVVIGASTGGVEALGEVLAGMPADGPPIVVVQHLPASFTGRFAARLDEALPITVREAADGSALRRGEVLVAPGGWQLTVSDGTGGLQVRLHDDPPRGGHKPSVDVLFESAARLGRRTVGVLLTGMGRDGAQGLKALSDAGAITIAQDAATSVVFGMPRAAIELGAAQKVLPLTRIAAAILQS